MLVFVILCANLWPKFIRMKINRFIIEADSVLSIYLAYVAYYYPLRWYSRSLPGREGFLFCLFDLGPCSLMIYFGIALEFK